MFPQGGCEVDSSEALLTTEIRTAMWKMREINLLFLHIMSSHYFII